MSYFTSFCFCYCYRSTFTVVFQTHTVEFAPVTVLLQHIKIAIVITYRHVMQPGIHVMFQLCILHTSIFYTRIFPSAVQRNSLCSRRITRCCGGYPTRSAMRVDVCDFKGRVTFVQKRRLFVVLLEVVCVQFACVNSY